MLNLTSYSLLPIEQNMFSYFEELTKIPRGSGNMKGVADYCEGFAKRLGLKYNRDQADNIVIFKDGANGLENADPIILQGHLDIVCQAEEGVNIDFENEGLEILREGDFIKAKGTTLGADNGIAIAYIMAILASSDASHPPIEAIFTTDEETGLIGAGKLDCSILKAKKMINLDSETDNSLTVSCAGGQDVILKLPCQKAEKEGFKISLGVKGLLGGHSGVEIDKNRTNANILLGEILYRLKEEADFSIISINGGTKPNAIPQSAAAEIITDNPELLLSITEKIKSLYLDKIKACEPDFSIEIKKQDRSVYSVFNTKTTDTAIKLLENSPYGVIKMSEEIEGLVETSLNLGILSTESNALILHFALRSNKEKSLHALTDEVIALGVKYACESKVSSFYPPWEYKKDSHLRELYKKCYLKENGKEINIEAIHAGLECGLFSNKISGLDCISVGPDLFDVHTPNEKLDILSALKTFKLLLKVLAAC